jgi:hypothetical protein
MESVQHGDRRRKGKRLVVVLRGRPLKSHRVLAASGMTIARGGSTDSYARSGWRLGLSKGWLLSFGQLVSSLRELGTSEASGHRTRGGVSSPPLALRPTGFVTWAVLRMASEFRACVERPETPQVLTREEVEWGMGLVPHPPLYARQDSNL